MCGNLLYLLTLQSLKKYLFEGLHISLIRDILCIYLFDANWRLFKIAKIADYFKYIYIQNSVKYTFTEYIPNVSNFLKQLLAIISYQMLIKHEKSISGELQILCNIEYCTARSTRVKSACS